MAEPYKYSYTTCKIETVELDPGTYILEVWGPNAVKNGYNAEGGTGGYSRGELTLDERVTAFIHLGGQGSTTPGCNGGGKGSSTKYGSGAGATDIRLISDSLYSRIIVAGGGGSGGDQSCEPGGFGGGLKGGDAGDDGDAGTGASQETDTTKCADGQNTCGKGTFGYGGNSTYGAGAGAGWFGGSGSDGGEGSGGGSGYVLTEESYKPPNYLLNDKKYFLKNAITLAGDQRFKSPTSQYNETGHTGNGYAIITPLYPKRTLFRTPFKSAMATMKPSMIGIDPSLKFTFVSNNTDIIEDKKGMFRFSIKDSYSARVSKGKYHFYANGSSCGQSIFVQKNIYMPVTMNVELSNNVLVKINGDEFLKAPGRNEIGGAFIDPCAKMYFNFTMSDYDCKRNTTASLIISFHPFYKCSCQCIYLTRSILFISTLLLSYH